MKFRFFKIVVKTFYKILLSATGPSKNDTDSIQEFMSKFEKEKLIEFIRRFNTRLVLDKEEFELDKQKAQTDIRLK